MIQENGLGGELPRGKSLTSMRDVTQPSAGGLSSDGRSENSRIYRVLVMVLDFIVGM